MVGDIFSISIILFESICCRIFFEVFLVRKTSKKNTLTISFLITLILMALSFVANIFINDAILKAAIIICFYFFVQFIFYEFRLPVMLILALTLYVMLIAFDYLAMQIIMLAFSIDWSAVSNSVIYFPFAAIISKLLFFIAVITMKKFNAYFKGIEVINTIAI